MSEVWWISTSSVQTSAQPPSTLTPHPGTRGRVAEAPAVAVRHLAIERVQRAGASSGGETAETPPTLNKKPGDFWRSGAGGGINGS